MAMNHVYLNLLRGTLNHVRPEPGVRLKTLALGYPDLIASREEILAIFPSLPATAFSIRSDSDVIARRHGVNPLKVEIFDSDEIFKALGLDVDYIDIAPSRGIEQRIDLNEPFPISMAGQYDFVIDTGTLEHCFNVGQAFKNVADAVALNGTIVQAAPLNRFNHGFWNFSPTAYHDYYHDNGFRILYLKGWAGGVVGNFLEFDVSPVAGFKTAPENAALVCVCQKVEIRPHRWPTQWKYRT